MLFKSSPSKTYLLNLILIFILGIGSWLRFQGLGNFYFWGDEAFHINLLPILNEGFKKLAQTDAHPPLFVVSLKAIIALVGVKSPLNFRIIPLASGILTILVSFLIGKTISANKSVGLFVAYLTATSPFLIEHSQLVRSYGLLIFLSFLVVWFLNQDLSKGSNYVALLIVTFLAASTHYSFFILQPGLVVWGYFSMPARSPFSLNWKRTFWIVLNLACLLAALYLIKQFPKDFLRSHIGGIISLSGAPSLIRELNTTQHLWIRFFGTQIKGYPILTIFFFFGGIMFLTRSKKFPQLFFVSSVYALGFLFDLLGKYPLTSGRHSSFLIIPTLLAMIYFIAEIFKRNKLLPLSLFLILVLYQVRNPSTVFVPNNNRWAWGEETYDFKLLEPLSKEIVSGKFLNHPIILDGGDVDPIILEKNFSPPWSLFNTAGQEYRFCRFMDLETQEGLCRCLERVSQANGGDEFYVLYTRLIDWRRLTPLESNPCFTTTQNFKLSDQFTISSIRKRN